MTEEAKAALEDFVRWAREWIPAHPEFDPRQSRLFKSSNVIDAEKD